MEAADLVRRVPSPGDRRASLIEARVPPKRRDKVLEAVDRSDDACFAALTAAERKELLRLVGKCTSDLEARL
jgi:DNA-binding MarR family transcriptional regulator